MKKLGLFFLVVAAIVGGFAATFYYFLQQATKLPDWYSNHSTPPKTLAEAQKSRAAIEQKIQAKTEAAIQKPAAQPSSAPASPTVVKPNPPVSTAVASKPVAVAPAKNPDVEIKLKPEELNDLIVTNMTEKSPPKALAGFQTTVQNNTLKTGAVVDIKELQKSKVGSNEQELLSQLSQNLPPDAQKIYIGIEGQPEVKNGRLQLGENTRIRVGNLVLSLAEIRDRFGISPEQIQEKLNVNLNLQNLNVEDIEFKNGTAVLRGSTK